MKLKDLHFFKKVCTQFYFAKSDDMDDESTSLIFTKADCIFELDYTTEATNITFEYDEPFQDQPIYFVTNVNQTLFFAASNR